MSARYTLLSHELLVDLFAGGGGASEGVFLALGRHPDIAINHDPDAVAVHARNHPTTKHFCQSIWEVRPQDACEGRPVGLLWASPDCRHFSRAAGGKPRWKSVRSLPGVILTWAKHAAPRVIIVENVQEMKDWGPLLPDGTPCPDRLGKSFRSWCSRLRNLGYTVEFKNLCAADFGVPTIRTRLFIVARRDGQPITWPQPTHHREPSLLEERWIGAAACIDWSIPAPSIFTRARPLKEATLQRIARGLHRFVLGVPNPFIVDRMAPHVSTFYGQATGAGADFPLGTVTAQGNHHALVSAHLAPVTHTGGNRGSAVTLPLPTVTCANRGEQALISAVLGGCGGRAGQSPPRPMTAPLGTVTAKADQMLVSAFLAQHNGGATGRDAREPVATITTQATQVQAVTAFLAQHNGDRTGRDARDPVSTITTRATQVQAVTASLSAADAESAERVAAFLLHYYSHGKQAQDARQPLGTITTKGRFALVTVSGVPLPIVDIGMRMLAVHELQAAQGFRPDYDLTDGGRFTKTTAIRLIGNSVCPGMAAAVIRANIVPAPASSTLREAA